MINPLKSATHWALSLNALNVIGRFAKRRLEPELFVSYSVIQHTSSRTPGISGTHTTSMMKGELIARPLHAVVRLRSSQDNLSCVRLLVDGEG